MKINSIKLIALVLLFSSTLKLKAQDDMNALLNANEGPKKRNLPWQRLKERG
jgi:hypothetical protein